MSLTLDDPFDASVLSEMRTAREQVRFILEMYPSARNSDGLVLFHFLRLFKGVEVDKNACDVLCSFSAESVIRVRAEIQKRGEFLPSEETAIKRRRRQSLIRGYYAEQAYGESI